MTYSLSHIKEEELKRAENEKRKKKEEEREKAKNENEKEDGKKNRNFKSVANQNSINSNLKLSKKWEQKEPSYIRD